MRVPLGLLRRLNVALLAGRVALPAPRVTAAPSGATFTAPAGGSIVIGTSGRWSRAAKLATHYSNPSLGDLTVRRQGPATIFDVGEWKSTVASRKNDDGTISFITIDPAVNGFEFVVGERGGKRVLTIRDGQHEYVFNEGS